MDIYDLLWDKNKDIAEQTLEVPFLQHMQVGDLQADHYVNFTIQDINYLLRVTDMLQEMCEKVNAPEDLRDFMQDRYDSYKEYALDTLQQFNLKVRNHLLFYFILVMFYLFVLFLSFIYIGLPLCMKCALINLPCLTTCSHIKVTPNNVIAYCNLLQITTCYQRPTLNHTLFS